jgi:glucose-6-phosphate 1-dehydrogenase
MMTNDRLEPTVFAIFGGMGDLTWRKLVPALFDLSQDRSLPSNFSIIVVDRVECNEEKLRRRLHDGVKIFSRRLNVKAGEWSKFASHIHYMQGDFKKLRTYMD